MAEKQVIIVCGEASGDLNAAGLAREIRRIDPEIQISAAGGALLQQAGAKIFYDIRGLSVIGLFDVLKKLPRFIYLKKIILQKIKDVKPLAVIFVDFSGFNLRLAKAINHMVRTIYYVSPQVWASRPGRMKTIRKYIDKLIVLFKFEEEFYKKHGFVAEFCGHPLLDSVAVSMSKKELLAGLKLAETKTTIALLPGSRRQEISKILPVMLKASLLIQDKLDAQFIIAKSPGVEWDDYNRLVKRFNPNVKILEGKTYDCLNSCDFALVASGTATLETAIMQKPFVIIYKMGILNYLLYRPQVKLPYIGIVNIVAGRKVIPEFIQFRAHPAMIAKEAVATLKDHLRLEQIKKDLLQVKMSLGEKGASSRAARLIVDFLNKL